MYICIWLIYLKVHISYSRSTVVSQDPVHDDKKAKARARSLQYSTFLGKHFVDVISGVQWIQSVLQDSHLFISVTGFGVSSQPFIKTTQKKQVICKTCFNSQGLPNITVYSIKVYFIFYCCTQYSKLKTHAALGKFAWKYVVSRWRHCRESSQVSAPVQLLHLFF